MITENEAQELKKIIGDRHIAQISMHLIAVKFFNRFGEPFTSEYISRVFNARVGNKKLEQQIWNFAEKRKKEDEEEKERREAILTS